MCGIPSARPVRATASSIAALSLAIVSLHAFSGRAGAYTCQAAVLEAGGSPAGLSGGPSDCLLQNYDVCSCWVWLFQDGEGAVWGSVFSPADCGGGCEERNAGTVTDVWFYSVCDDPGVASWNDLRIHSVDASDCLVEELWSTGPFTTTHCVPGDRWTHVEVPNVEVSGDFAVVLEWGESPSGVQLATEDYWANLACSFGISGSYPGCMSSTCSCSGWSPSPAGSFIWFTDFNGDTVPDDLCALYGYPYAPCDPRGGYLYYEPVNLLFLVGVDCSLSTASEATSWGRVKALFP